jgi:hypothetical protein
MNTIYNKVGLLVLAIIYPFLASADRWERIDNDWSFALGNHTEAVATDFDASSWRKLNLPHDWSVEPEAAAIAGQNIGPFTRNSIEGSATGFTIGGEGWYRKTFRLDDRKEGERISLQFDGAYNETTVYVNGQKAYYNPYGYMTFRFDITPLLNPAGQDNVVTVRVLNQGKNTRWYAGSGIYRHVWLMRTPAVHIDDWHTLILAQADGSVCIRSRVFNETDNEVSVPFTAEVAEAKASREVNIRPHDSKEVNLKLKASSPRLWSPGSPNLYTATVSSGDDVLHKRIGFRTISMDANSGLFLNGEPILLKGGCVHHDCGLLGAASYDDAEYRKIRLLKENGYNAVRCSHNLPAQAFLDACDSLGMLVIDEVFDHWIVAKNPDDYHRFFQEFSDRDARRMVERDGCHPSIIMWSIGNEVPGRIEPEGVAAAARLRADVLAVDSSRAVTAAICDWDNFRHSWNDHSEKAFLSLDAGGYNYLYDKYESDHQAHPDRIMYGSESYPKHRSQNWDLVEKHPYVIGDFVWTAIDYLGEAGIGSAEYRTNGNQPQFQGWPWFNGWCGDIDLIGEKKPQAYYRDVVWRNAPITMAVEKPAPAGTHQSISAWGWQLEHNSWTFNDCTSNDKMTVNVYARSKQVRLYLNGRLLGTQNTSATYWAGFSVPYEPGVLRAVEFDGTNEGASFTLKTSGQPTGIRLRADRDYFSNDEQALIFITAEAVDAEGNVVRDVNERITFELTGNASLIATGNASPTDMESFRAPTVSLYEGRAMAIVRGNGTRQSVTLKATSENYGATTLVLNNQEGNAIERVSNSSGQSCPVSLHDGIYALNGVKYTNGTHLPKGMYIISQNNKTRKRLIK